MTAGAVDAVGAVAALHAANAVGAAITEITARAERATRAVAAVLEFKALEIFGRPLIGRLQGQKGPIEFPSFQWRRRTQG